MGTGPAGSVFGDNTFYRETLGTRRGGRHVAKRNIKLQARDLVRVGVLLPPLPHGVSVSGENSFYRAQRINGHSAGCPKLRYATGKPGKVQERDRVVIVEGSCGYRARGISIRGKFVLSRNEAV